MEYKKVINEKNGIETLLVEFPDGSGMSIPMDDYNSDYKAYLKWLEENNPEEV